MSFKKDDIFTPQFQWILTKQQNNDTAYVIIYFYHYRKYK
jgi:hypothetical protein